MKQAEMEIKPAAAIKGGFILPKGKLKIHIPYGWMVYTNSIRKYDQYLFGGYITKKFKEIDMKLEGKDLSEMYKADLDKLHKEGKVSALQPYYVIGHVERNRKTGKLLA